MNFSQSQKVKFWVVAFFNDGKDFWTELSYTMTHSILLLVLFMYNYMDIITGLISYVHNLLIDSHVSLFTCENFCSLKKIQKNS